MASFETTLILIGSFGLGLSHAFEIDHMAAINAFVSRKPSFKQAATFGAQWAVGHGISLLLLGSVLFAFKLAISDEVAHWLERAVGLALLCLGIGTLLKLRSSGIVPVHHHGRKPFLMGVLHGIAGTAAFVGESLVVFSSSYALVAAYTLAFSVGVLAAMSFYACIVGQLLTCSARWSATLLKGSQTLMALWACAVGAFWAFK